MQDASCLLVDHGMVDMQKIAGVVDLVVVRQLLLTRGTWFPKGSLGPSKVTKEG